MKKSNWARDGQKGKLFKDFDKTIGHEKNALNLIARLFFRESY